MGKLCIKCGYERQETDDAPETECPRCGVIYHRVEAASATTRQVQQQLRTVRARRRLRAHEEDRSLGGLFSFGWMVTPLLCQISFVMYLIGALIGAVLAVSAGHGKTAVAMLVSVLLVRLILEGIMVIFRLWGDVAEVRSLLTEQAIEASRRDA